MKATIYRQAPGLLTALFIYVVGAVIGVQMPRMPVVESIESAGTVQPFSIQFFLSHNAPIVLFTAAGFLTLGVITLISLLFNGAALSSVLASAHDGGITSEALLGILPHGPFEIMGLLLAGAVGFTPISIVCRLALGRTVYTKTEVKDALWLVAAALLLTALAAVVESWVTPSVIEWKIGAK